MAGQHALPDVHVPQQIQNKPQLKKTSKPNQMSDYGFFKKYEDEERPGQMSYEGLREFLGDLEIDGQSDESLFLCYVMESKELGVVTDAEFNGLHKKLGVSDNGQLKHALKKRIAAIRESSQEMAAFLKYLFVLGNEGNAKLKVLAIDKGLPTLELVLPNHKELKNSKLLPEFLEFCKERSESGELKGFRRDEWESLVQFVRQHENDLGSYLEDDAWPLLFDNFVAWKRKSEAA